MTPLFDSHLDARSGVDALLTAADNTAAEHQQLLDQNAELHVRVQELETENAALLERIEEYESDHKDDKPKVMGPLQPGDIVQITEERPGLVGALLMVHEVKTWGVQGFIHHVESFEQSARIYLRIETGRFEWIGHAVMVPTGIGEGGC